MDQQLTASILAAIMRAGSSLIKSLRMLFALDARPYRPEKYYMRGPGPKWRERHLTHNPTQVPSVLR